jgi:hypothetical protein
MFDDVKLRRTAGWNQALKCLISVRFLLFLLRIFTQGLKKPLDAVAKSRF